MNLMKGIKIDNKNAEGFAQFQDEEEEKEKEKNDVHNFKRLSSGSSLGFSSSKTIHRSITRKGSNHIILKMNEMIYRIKLNKI